MSYNSESIQAGDLKLRVLLPINCQKQNARNLSCQRLKNPGNLMHVCFQSGPAHVRNFPDFDWLERAR